MSTERAHTPGPWKRDNLFGIVQERGNFVIISLDWHSTDNPADLNLIAAAPELLTALEDVMRDRPMCGHPSAPSACRWCYARTALAKARGESGGGT